MEAIELFLDVFAVAFGITGGIALAALLFWLGSVLIEWIGDKLYG